MKFKENDILYYVCPISFIIEKIKVEYAVKEADRIYYIDISGAYFAEECLHKCLKDAKHQALDILNSFYELIFADIQKANPTLHFYEIEEDFE